MLELKFGNNYLTPMFELNTKVIKKLTVYCRTRSISANKLTVQIYMNLHISCSKVSILIRTLLVIRVSNVFIG